MMDSRDFPIQPSIADAVALDHAREFVELVSSQALQRYRALLRSSLFRALLEDPRRFDHGQLFVYAEYQVFKEEFCRRFPDAGQSACVNAFSSLFLKNDISMANLLELIEEQEQGELDPVIAHRADEERQ